MSTQAEGLRVSVEEARVRVLSGPPLDDGVSDAVHAGDPTEPQMTLGRYSDVTDTLELPIERAVINARTS